MFTFLRRAGRKINRHAGLGIQRVYLYRMSKSDRPAACGADNDLALELLPPLRIGSLPDIGPFDVMDGKQRLERGDRCYIVNVDGRLAHYSWVQASGSHPITKAGSSVSVRKGEFWIYDCRTAEWARGKRIYPWVIARIVDEYFRAGYHTAWIYTTEANTASQRGIMRAGFCPLSVLVAVRAGTHYFRIGGRSQHVEFAAVAAGV